MRDQNILTVNGIDINNSLELLGDMTMYDSLLNDYLVAYNDRIKRIETYKNANDMSNYAIEVHSLKSDSKYLGFTKLADLAYKHEMASKANDTTSVNNHYQELIDEANRIYGVAQEYINDNKDVNQDHAVVNNDDIGLPPQVQLISPEEVSLSTKAILVADDSSIIRNFVNDAFSKDYDVLMASNGREVINIINSDPNKIAALLLDLNMPEVDGFQVLQYLKENNLFSKIPVSIISGVSDKETVEKAFTYPIIDMLNKPFTMDNVKLVVEKTIDFNINNN